MPTENTRNYKQICNEFSDGFLNFSMILQKLKSKKYGPGNNKIKTDSLIADIRRIFNVAEKYYTYDSNSIRISRILESYFENEINKLNKMPFLGAAEAASNTITIPARPDKKAYKHKGESARPAPTSRRYDDYSEDIDSASSSSYRKKKKDKKKDKSKKKKKKKYDRDSQDAPERTSIGNMENGIDLNEDIEKGEAFGSTHGNTMQKQILYDNIIKYLSVTQKKGIIPIIKEQLSKEDPVGYQKMIKSNQKFEFDLFNLSDKTCQRLEQYVNKCI